MRLRQKQSQFVALVAQLILLAEHLGYELTFGEAYRSKEEARRLYDLYKAGKGPRASLNSIHCVKLAIDLNLFKDGKYLTSTKAHQPLGEWWEKQSGANFECCWGGRFSDGNHYSIAHGGRK